MSKLRATFRHVWCIPIAAAASLLLGAAGCGKTTSIGQVVPGPEAGTSGDGGAAAGATADGAAGTSSGGNSGHSSGGVSSEAGATADAGTTTACGLPRPNPIPNPTAEERARATLIRGLCNTLAQQGCLDGDYFLGRITEHTRTCPLDERITACEQDLLFSYLQLHPDCDDEWQTLVRCEKLADHASDPGPPYSACAISDPSNYRPLPPIARCSTERSPLALCEENQRDQRSITGTRATCSFGPSGLDPGACSVQCTLPDQNVFHTECSAPAGLPLSCMCHVNGNVIRKPGSYEGELFLVSSCREAAQLMANGECVDRLDCCFKYTTSSGDKCACMGNEEHGMASCAAAAEASGGEVVDICPHYESPPTSCWPPWNPDC